MVEGSGVGRREDGMGGVGMVKVKGKECLDGEWGWEGTFPPPPPPPLPSPSNVLPGRTHKGCMVTTLYVVTSY